MSNILNVQWTVIPISTPQPIIACNRCGRAVPFISSEKFRLNAHGKCMDAWLIYNCTACENTWNRPIFERRNLRKIAPTMLHLLHSNDRELANSIAFDVEHLHQQAPRVKTHSDVRVQKQIVSGGDGQLSRLEIFLRVPMPTSLRTDRLLSKELNLSRARISDLGNRGDICLSEESSRGLRRSVKDNDKININLENVNDAAAIENAALFETTQHPRFNA